MSIETYTGPSTRDIELIAAILDEEIAEQEHDEEFIPQHREISCFSKFYADQRVEA